MRLSKHEQIIKEKMQGFNPDLDTGALWESLNEFVPENIPKKKKRRLGFYLLFLIPLILLIGLLFNKVNVEGNKTIEKGIKNSFEKTRNEEKQILNNKESVSDNEFVVNDNSKKNKSISGNVSSESGNRLRRNSINEEKLVGEEIYSKSPIESENIVLETEEVREVAQEINRKEISFSIRKNLLYSKLTILKPLPISKEREVLPINIITKFPKSLSHNYIVWNIGVGFGSFDHSFEPNNTNSESYVTYLESNTKPVWSVDLGLTYNFGNGIYLNSGIAFTQLVTQIHPNWDRYLDENNPYPDGLTQRVVSQLEYEAIGHNYQNIFDIPLNIGYKLFNKGKLNLSLEGGAIFNAFTYSKGVVLDKNLKLKYYDKGDKNPYDNRFDLGWKAAINMDYLIGSNTRIYFKPNLSTRSIGYRISDLGIREKYTTYSLKVGCNYKL